MRTRFILIEPSHAGNVGASARAMKVMGFDDLVLVRPRWANVLKREETIQRASGALDVLRQARIVDSLDEAVDGMQHLCATAMTPRDFGAHAYAPRERFAQLVSWYSMLQNSEQQNEWIHGQEFDTAPNEPQNTLKIDSVAMLFGTERFGMSNEDVYRCHSVITIPTNGQFGSLNLAAALQLIAYEWRLALGGFALPAAAVQTAKLADAQAVQGLLKHLEQALVHAEFLDPESPKKLMPRLNQLFNRAALREEEVHILRGIAKSILAMKQVGPPAKSQLPE